MVDFGVLSISQDDGYIIDASQRACAEQILTLKNSQYQCF